MLLVGGRVAAVLPWLRTSQPSIFRLGILPRPIGAGRDGVSPELELINITICRLVGRDFAVGEWLQLATPIKVLATVEASVWWCNGVQNGGTPIPGWVWGSNAVRSESSWRSWSLHAVGRFWRSQLAQTIHQLKAEEGGLKLQTLLRQTWAHQSAESGGKGS